MTEKTKISAKPDTLPGTEGSSKGNYIPLEKRTNGDREKIHAVISDATIEDPHSSDIKNPDNEFENPAPMERDQQGQGGKPMHRDREGQQGGTKGGGHEVT